ncbi:MAG: hypothetical protein U0167_15585 [bacterium]
MDLRAALSRGALAGALGLLAAGCGDTPFEYSRDALRLPATLKEALPLATLEAQRENPSAFVARLGGGLAVMDDHGRSFDHTFIFYAHDHNILRKITVDLIHGTPWLKAETVPLADGHPFVHPDTDLSLDSDSVVERAIQLAPQYGVDLAPHYAARLSSVPAFPEPHDVTEIGDVIAWRVDFLVIGTGSTAYFSYARFYFDPATGDLLHATGAQNPVKPPQAELYPFP